jgi:uncharacterized protein YlxW (UPF0749 family)
MSVDQGRPARDDTDTSQAAQHEGQHDRSGQDAENSARPEQRDRSGRGRRAARKPGLSGIADLLLPRINRAQAVVAVLCLLLGFGVTTQVRSNQRDGAFATARPDELVRVLDELSQRGIRLRSDIRELEQTKARLERDTRGDTAVAEARARAMTYGLLAGTLPATGPGIELTITDPDHKVTATVLLDTLQELRDAGAEVVQINDIRVGVDTYFVDARGGVVVDRNWLQAPYRFLVIGEPGTLAGALDIPGGVMETLRGIGANGRVTQRQTIDIRALRSARQSRPR